MQRKLQKVRTYIKSAIAVLKGNALNTFEIKVAEWKGKIVPSLSVAYGYSIMNKKDANKIHNVIHLADEIMYLITLLLFLL